MKDWNRLRREFPVVEKYTYLNHAAITPLARRVADAMKEFIDDNTTNGAVNCHRWRENIEECRRLFARLIHADSQEIAFTKNTTQGLIIAANGIDWREGDNVIISDCAFPANVYPWMSLERVGVEARMVKEEDGRITLDSIENMIDSKTRAIALSFVEYVSGFRSNLKAIGDICQKNDIWFIVDAIQGLGVFDLDVNECHIDIMSADGHKWLLGPEGAAVFFVSRERLDRLKNTNLGYLGVVNSSDYSEFDMTMLPDARRFEEGSYNMTGLQGLKAAVEWLFEIGIENIEKRILSLLDLLIEGLKSRGYRIISPLGEGERSGILSFAGDRYSSAQLCQTLFEDNIVVADRNNAVRVSPHFYNNEEEIEHIIRTLPGGC